MSIAAFLLIKF